MSQPKVSVCIPVYNNSAYLQECFDSVLHQTLGSIEIIIVDDGSTDQRTISILNDYTINNQNVKLIRQKNSGYGKAMNVAISMASGKYIGIVESDDFINDTMYSTLFTLAEKYKLDFIKCGFSMFYGKKTQYVYKKKQYVKNAEQLCRVIDPKDEPSVLLQHTLNQNGLYRRDFIINNKILFNETPGAAHQDNGFFFLLYMMAQRIYCIPDVFYNLRRDNPGSSYMAKDKIFCFCDEFRYIHSFLKCNPAQYKIFLPLIWCKKYIIYHYNLRRLPILDQFSFLKQFAREFALGSQTGELQESFLSPSQWKSLQLMKKNVYMYWLYWNYVRLKKNAKKLLCGKKFNFI